MIGKKIILWKKTLTAIPTSELFKDLIIIFNKAWSKAAKNINKYIEVIAISLFYLNNYLIIVNIGQWKKI